LVLAFFIETTPREPVERGLLVTEAASSNSSMPISGCSSRICTPD
jgi:hypothetical protein